MALKLMYITNNSSVAKIAQNFGVERIWIDLETKGKQERQGHIDSVKSHHTIDDIKQLRSVVKESELLVRINPINADSKREIDEVIKSGADIIMLPMWKSVNDVDCFLRYVNGKVKTTLLIETKEAVECLDDVLALGGFDEIHIGLNDLHLSYGLNFMFELLSNGTVETLCNKFKQYNLPYGFGGIACLDGGLLPAKNIIMEHYRLGSSRVILSRSFCDAEKIDNLEKIESVFSENIAELREYEKTLVSKTNDEFFNNVQTVKLCVEEIVRKIKGRNL